jgi:hypothetical protein
VLKVDGIKIRERKMKYITYNITLLFLLSLPALAQNSSSYQAIVNTDEATFIFPLNPSQEYEWSNGGLTYKWSVAVSSSKGNYEFGFYLYTPMGATPEQRGDINALLQAGQFNVWRGNKVINNVNIDGHANEAQDQLIIKIIDRRLIQRMFSQRPKYVTFSIQLELFEEPANVRVHVKYSSQIVASKL